MPRIASTSDTEVIAALIASDERPLDEAVAATMRGLEGAYSVVALSEGQLSAFRDPLGFRPLELGRLGDDWVVASETCALDLVGAKHVRSVEPGRARRRRRATGSARVPPAGSPTPAHSACSSTSTSRRPDSDLDGVEVYGARVRMGEQLAREAPVDADLVMPIPDSGRRRRSASRARAASRSAKG